VVVASNSTEVDGLVILTQGISKVTQCEDPAVSAIALDLDPNTHCISLEAQLGGCRGNRINSIQGDLTLDKHTSTVGGNLKNNENICDVIKTKISQSDPSIKIFKPSHFNMNFMPFK
jgi:hypothetical protein